MSARNESVIGPFFNVIKSLNHKLRTDLFGICEVFSFVVCMEQTTEHSGESFFRSFLKQNGVEMKILSLIRQLLL